MLTCFTPPHPKIRLGSDNDGGYIIVDIPNKEKPILFQNIKPIVICMFQIRLDGLTD